MSFWRVFSVVIVSTCWLLVLSKDEVPPAPSTPAALTGPTTAKPAVTNSSRANSTLSGGGSTKKFGSNLGADSSMIQRALYVLIGITIIGVLYFLIRAVRLKKPAHKKKYGLLSNYDDSVEMEAVESDEDDTLYEARSLRRSEVNTRLQTP
uniref:Family with sequence similarity 174 member C n=1 Tax=Poecilia reticulata TaxID=8081 RepID=A0A3P9MVI8_POERE